MMKTCVLSLFALTLAATAQEPAPDVAPPAIPFETPPVLSASAILQSQFLQGPHFQVNDPVPTSQGINEFSITSDYGPFQADGNDMLMRRVAEIRAITALREISSTKEFENAAEKAAVNPLVAAKDLIQHPVDTLSGVQKGVWKFLNQAGQSVKEIGEGRKSDAAQGNVVTNALGYSKVKRDLALRLGVDPYSSNPVFQKELDQVAWPVFAGGFTVKLGIAAATFGIGGAAGTAISATGMTGDLNGLLRDNSPSELRLKNLGVLLGLGVSRPTAVAFLNNNAFSPTTQTVLVAALAELTAASGQEDFIRLAATSANETDAVFYQESARVMVRINTIMPVTLITHLNGLPICQTEGGAVIAPLAWDYAVWTPATERFLQAFQAMSFEKAPTEFAVAISGVVSPVAIQALAAKDVNYAERQLPGPLKPLPVEVPVPAAE